MKRLLLDLENQICISIPDNPDYFLLYPSLKILSVKWGKQRILSEYKNVSGYPAVKMGNKTTALHRIVALCFIGDPEGRDVNHIDGDKHNNHPENLEYVTRSENIEHSLSSGLHSSPRIPVVAYNDSNTGYWFRSQSEVNLFGFYQPNVYKVLKGLRKTAGGFHWERA